MHVDPIPHSLIGETAWMLLAQASNDVHHPMRIVTFATVDDNCVPRARLMVVRGADSERECIWFHTDLDSRKVEELRLSPQVAVVAHDPNLGIQLRISGSVKLHHDNAIAQDHWLQTNLSLRHAYGEPQNGEQLPFTDPRLDRLWHHGDANGRIADRKRFVVIEVQVTSIEWQQFAGAKQWAGTVEPAKKTTPKLSPLQSRRLRSGRRSMDRK